MLKRSLVTSLALQNSSRRERRCKHYDSLAARLNQIFNCLKSASEIVGYHLIAVERRIAVHYHHRHSLLDHIFVGAKIKCALGGTRNNARNARIIKHLQALLFVLGIFLRASNKHVITRHIGSLLYALQDGREKITRKLRENESDGRNLLRAKRRRHLIRAIMMLASIVCDYLLRFFRDVRMILERTTHG